MFQKQEISLPPPIATNLNIQSVYKVYISLSHYKVSQSNFSQVSLKLYISQPMWDPTSSLALVSLLQLTWDSHLGPNVIVGTHTFSNRCGTPNPPPLELSVLAGTFPRVHPTSRLNLLLGTSPRV